MLHMRIHTFEDWRYSARSCKLERQYLPCRQAGRGLSSLGSLSMKLLYTDHLKSRLKQRGIPLIIVKEIFGKPLGYYWDNLRNHYVVVGEVVYKGKRRKVLAAYDKIGKEAEVITVHPITSYEIRQRLNSGRWRREKSKN